MPLPSRLRYSLAASYALLIVYASLSPFSGWQEQGLAFLDVLLAPPAQTYTWFDAASNLIAYFPLGFLLGLALRERHAALNSVLLATLLALLLSASMEWLQMYLPRRISSNMDMISNGIGACAGAVLGASIVPSAWFAWLRQQRLRLFRRARGEDFGLALIFLWGIAQSNPSLPMLGNVFITRAAQQPFAPPPQLPFDWLQCLTVALNLLLLGGLLLTLLHARRHALSALLLILAAVALAKFIAAALLLKSWALLLWLNGEALLGITLGLAALFILALLPLSRQRLLLAVLALAYLAVSNLLLDSVAPAAAMPLYAWRYGHLLNYNGLSDTIVLLFPVLLLFYLWRSRPRAAGIIAAKEGT